MPTMNEIAEWVCSNRYACREDCPPPLYGGACDIEACVESFIGGIYNRIENGSFGRNEIDYAYRILSQMPPYTEHTCEYCGTTENLVPLYLDHFLGVTTVYLCEYCRIESIVSCDNCGTGILDFLCNPREDGHVFCCGSCETQHERRGFRNYVNGYHHTSRETKGMYPKMMFSEDSGTHLYGLEVELDNEHLPNSSWSFAEYVQNIFSNRDIGVFQEEDGSLINGWEVIFPPMSYEFIKNNIDVFCDFIEKKNELGFLNDAGSAGMHIHVSRNSMGRTRASRKDGIARAILIVEKFFNEIEILSGRERRHLHEWSSPRGFKKIDSCRKLLTNAELFGGNKYSAVNVNPANTIEFRVWNSPANVDDFQAYIDCTNAIVRTATERSTQQIAACRSLRSALKCGMTEELSNYMEVRGL